MWNKILIFWNKLSIASVIYICLIGILLTFWYGERNNVKQLERLYQQSEAGISAIEAEYLETITLLEEVIKEYKPTLIEAEIHLFSDELKVAGTCDMVCEINGELWVIDFKTSNHLQTTYDLQTALYAKCFEECFNKKVDRTGVLWLKSSKRGSKKDKMQGKGWEMYESPRTQEDNLNIYKAVRTLFDIENPNHKPAFTEFRTTAKRDL